LPHISTQHKSYYGTAAGNGHCVALVRECTNLPHTSAWRRGELVRGAGCAPGTAIATFDPDGTYGNRMDGSSHAAILLAEHTDGLMVADQWLGRTVGHRVIRFRNGHGDAVNDGDRYYVIELDEDGGA
jgi:hypothetical protein